jgi:hypothetical protein
MGSELRFLPPERAPSIDEAMTSCPTEYALRSNDENDVIFLGGSSCRCGIDPKRLAGLRAFNLGSIVGLQPRAILATLRIYLQHHRSPRIVVLCLSPITFDFATDDVWSTGVTRHFLLNYGALGGESPPLPESIEYFIRRGISGAFTAHAADLRDVPLMGQEGSTYRTFKRDFLAGHGFIPMPGEHGADHHNGPRETVRIGKEWTPFVRDLSAECRDRGIRLLVLFTPISAEANSARDYSPIDDWCKSLRAEGVTIDPQRVPEIYPPKLMWDSAHLNAGGVEKFMLTVAQGTCRLLPGK